MVAVGKATSICSSQWAKPRSASMVVRAWVENHGMEESSHWCSRADALVWHQLRLEDRVAIARHVDVGPPGVVTTILQVEPFQESSTSRPRFSTAYHPSDQPSGPSMLTRCLRVSSNASIWAGSDYSASRSPD